MPIKLAGTRSHSLVGYGLVVARVKSMFECAGGEDEPELARTQDDDDGK